MAGGINQVRATEIAWREVHDQVIVLDLCESSYLELNKSASTLWKALAAGATDQELASLLVDRYGVEAERAAEDVAHFITMLRESSLLEPS